MTRNTHEEIVPEKPRVTIGMPVFNEGRYLAEAIESLLRQDFEDFELLIRDNASGDDTGTICKAYAARDRRVSYQRNDVNLGAQQSFNQLVHDSHGRYFFLACGHDLWHPAFISRCLSALENDPNAVLSYPMTVWIAKEGHEIATDTRLMDIRSLTAPFRPLRQFNLVLWDCHNSHAIHGLIRTELLRRTRLARPTIGPDIILLAELSLLGAFAQIPEPFFYVRRMREHDEIEVLKRQARDMFPSNDKRSLVFPYAKFALEYLSIVTHRPLKLSFSNMVLVIVSLSLKFLYEIIRCPWRPFRFFRLGEAFINQKGKESSGSGLFVRQEATSLRH